MDSKVDFIIKISEAARLASYESGLSFELMLAQAAQETGWGAKVLSGTNNIFNIKADSSWTGARKTFQVPEYVNGHWVTVNADFRVYATLEDAFRDRVSFLQSNPRYANLFSPSVLGDLKAEATALQAAGYATDPGYASALEAVFNGKTMRFALEMLKADLSMVDSHPISGLNGWRWNFRVDAKTGVATSKIIDNSEEVVISAGPNESLTRNPDSGVFTLIRTNGAKEYFDPLTNTRILQGADGSGYIGGGEGGTSIPFGTDGLTINTDGSFRVQPNGGSAAIDLFKRASVFEVTNTTPTIGQAQTPSSSDPSVPAAANGTAVAGGGYTVSTDPARLNTATDPFSALVGDSLTGGFRPGATAVSGTGARWDSSGDAF